MSATLYQTGTYQLVVQSESGTYNPAPYQLTVRGTPAPELNRVFLVSIARAHSGGW